MTAIAAARGEPAQNGIQPFDARHHLRPVAELIAQVFANEMDSNGRTALEEMETIGRWSPVLGGLLGSALFSEFISGFVWIENGQLIGNVTLQRTEESGTRWRISNVAVAEPYRGRGIARQLMLATLREIARRGGSWAVLQVRVDNPTARRLYEKLAFTNVCQDGFWYAPALPATLPPVAPPRTMRLLAPGEWRPRYLLARDSRSPLAHWAEPVNPGAYRTGVSGALRRLLGEVSGLQRVRTGGMWQDAYELIGDVEVTANGMGDRDRLVLALRPGAPAGAAEALVSQGLHGLAALHGAPAATAVAEYHGELAEPGIALAAAGFRAQRILLTMRRLMTPADAGLSVPGLD